MTKLPFLPQSLTRGAAFAAPTASASAPAPTISAVGLFTIAKSITLSLGCPCALEGFRLESECDRGAGASAVSATSLWRRLKVIDPIPRGDGRETEEPRRAQGSRRSRAIA